MQNSKTDLNKLVRNIPQNFSFKNLPSNRKLDYKNLFDRLKVNDELIKTYSILPQCCIDNVYKILSSHLSLNSEIELDLNHEIAKSSNYLKKFNFLYKIHQQINEYFNPLSQSSSEINLELVMQRIEDKDNLKLRILRLVLQEFFAIFPTADRLLAVNNFLIIKELFFLSTSEKSIKLQKANLMIALLDLINMNDPAKIDAGNDSIELIKDKSIFEIYAIQNINFQRNLAIISDAINKRKDSIEQSPPSPPLPNTEATEIQRLNSSGNFLVNF